MEQKPDRFLPASILAAAVMISAALIYTTRAGNNSGTGGPNGETTYPAGSGGDGQIGAPVNELGERDVILGEEDAPVTLIEYGDYQCPFCGKFFTETEPLLRENYVKTGKVRMIFRDFPVVDSIVRVGTDSVDSAEAAECAKDQGKFWAFHDALFTAEAKDGKEGNGNLNRTLFVKIAGDAGMDVAAFTKCYDGNTYADEVAKSYAAAGNAGVNGTPAVFINGAEIAGGARPYSQYQAFIDNLLK